MSDYEINIQGLRPNDVYGKVVSPSNHKKYKATTAKSKSRQKQIITSFSKRSITDKQTLKSQEKYFAQRKKQQPGADASNIKKSDCQSEYYIKTAESKNDLGLLQLQDEVRVKQGQLQILASRLAKAQYELKALAEQNQLKSQRIQTLERQLSTMLARSLKHLQTQQIGTDLVYECQKYKQDQRRLLKMLQTTSEYQYFSKFALIDEGVQFLRQINQVKKSEIDALSSKKVIHFCNCSKEFISQPSFWVPQKIYKFGRQFIKQRNGEFTMSQCQLLLYQLNRLWRQRQKKIINTLNGQKSRQLQKLQRKLTFCKSAQRDPIRK